MFTVSTFLKAQKGCTLHSLSFSTNVMKILINISFPSWVTSWIPSYSILIILSHILCSWNHVSIVHYSLIILRTLSTYVILCWWHKFSNFQCENYIVEEVMENNKFQFFFCLSVHNVLYQIWISAKQQQKLTKKSWKIYFRIFRIFSFKFAKVAWIDI